MRIIMLSLAALLSLSVVVPYATPAKADVVVIKRHHHHFWNYAPHRDKTVIIKH